MIARDDGGLAFPAPAIFDKTREQVNAAVVYEGYDGCGGMTLRDYFAIHASESDVSNAIADLCRDSSAYPEFKNSTVRQRNAIARMACADALLKARAS